MELALYCPIYGFYERQEDTIGRRGHFYTSVSVGSLFGELLGWQFAEWLSDCGVSHQGSGPRDWDASIQAAAAEGERLQIVEAGAHDGRLAADILSWLRRRRPSLFEQLEYWIVEPSSDVQSAVTASSPRSAPLSVRVIALCTIVPLPGTSSRGVASE